MHRHRVETAIATLSLVTVGFVSVLPAVMPFDAVATADTAATGAAGLFVPAAGRLLDTRNGTGGYATPMPANTVRTVAAAGGAGIPASGVSAVALTLTVVGAGTIGAVSVAPGDVATPTGTALVFNPGDSVSNTDLVALHADGHCTCVAEHGGQPDHRRPGLLHGRQHPGAGRLRAGRPGADRRYPKRPERAAGPGGDGQFDDHHRGRPGQRAGWGQRRLRQHRRAGQTSNGYLRTYAAGAAVPTTGALGFDEATQAVSAAVPLSSGGAFTVLVGLVGRLT